MNRPFGWDFSEISYVIKEENLDSVDENEEDDDENIVANEAKVIIESRTRSGGIKGAQTEFEELKVAQDKLREDFYQDLMKRYENNEIIVGENQNKNQLDLEKVECYKSQSELPKEYKRGQLFFDEQNLALLVPTKFDPDEGFGVMAFHLYTIKNIFMTFEQNQVYMRINFHTPAQQMKDIKHPDYENDEDNLFIKEITMKCENGGAKLQ